ncbi:hypothetical protein D3Z45_12155 [Lachnospiraceae bacterium]|nr:hypothetical protein [Lachnospiraceae bacterium]
MKSKVRMQYWCSLFTFAIGLLLVCGIEEKPSTAYFTTYASAKGGYELQAGTETEIEEEIIELTKHIRIVNTGKVDCFVRVKVFAGSLTPVSYLDDSGKWRLEGDGYWYYQDILASGAATEELAATIEVPAGMEDMMDSFDVVVIQECTAVLYREDGTPYADWERKIEAGEGAGG